ncbi:Pectin lyase-like superfamily protein [Citrus sinensis]|nr:Pectin lyase-like superfamily protein [Citrus sinensis]
MALRMTVRYFHINILGCYNLKLNDLKITAHADSPNTEGIHIGRSNGIEISHSVIATGQGISVGSLGKGIKDEEVVGLTVRNCTFTCTSNGVRVKTWPDSHIGIASNFTFEDIVMNNVENPIVIDQLYCPYNKCNIKVPSQVKTSNVRFNNIRGTSANKVAV